MKKITLELNYKENTYLSKEENVSEDDFVVLKNILQRVASGECTYFNFETKDGFLYFPKNILEQSILKINIL